MKAVIPDNFDIDSHLTEYPPSDHDLPKFNRDHALYILSQINLVIVRNEDLENGNGGFVALSSVLLQKAVHDYRKYLDYFLRTGVIETNGIYKPGIFFGGKGKCRLYRFNAIYNTPDVELVPISYSKEYIERETLRRKKHDKGLLKEYGHLIKWLLPSSGLEVDPEAATKYLKTRRQAQLDNPDMRDIGTNSLHQKVLKDPQQQYRQSKTLLDQIVLGNINFSVDDIAGRMHTPLTNMLSGLRNFVTYKGEEMVSIDVTNSQPYMSTVLFNKNFYRVEVASKNRGKNKLRLEQVNKAIYKEIHKTNMHTITNMLVNRDQLSDNEDFRLFKSLVSAQGNDRQDLYSYLLTQSVLLGGIIQTRRDAKEALFEVLFSKNSSKKISKSKKFFQETFPSVEKLFFKLKEGRHERLAILLQSIEAYIILKVITPAIAKKYPDIPLFTIHDSIVTTAKHAEVVKTFMEQELTRLIGLPPKLKVERWHPDEVDWAKYGLTPPVET